MATLPADHFCAWRDEAERLSTKLQDAEQRLAALERHVFGRRSEKKKMPPMDREVRAGTPLDPATTRAKREARAAAKAQLPTEVVHHAVPADGRTCPQCARPAGAAGVKETVTYSYVPGHLRRRVHRRETLACACGHIVTAPPPDRVFDRTPYEASLVAHLIVAKCADALPLYRLEKQFARFGVPLSRSTMTDLFHRAGAALAPLADRVLARIAASEVVLADETVLRQQGTTKRPYLWTFIADSLIGYVYSPSRSGETPRALLGGTSGVLVVDGYTGYNAVTTVAGRVRAGCLGHARRKFFEALATAPEAQFALDTIRAIYRVEHDAAEQGIVRTAAHRALRQACTRPLVEKLRTWLLAQRPAHLPKGPMGAAIRYALGQWDALTRFVDDARLPPDNNESEAALRIAALGRKNFLFVGHEAAGKNLAVLYTLVSSCEANGVNPWTYLVDVLGRLDTHPASRIDELLPDRWQPPTDTPAVVAA